MKFFTENGKTVNCYVVNDKPWLRAQDVATILNFRKHY